MNWVFLLLGVFLGFFILGNLFTALFFHIPYAKKISKTHALATAQRIDGKLDIWHGPVPYGRILFLPFFMTLTLFSITLLIYLFFNDSFLFFLGGAVLSGALSLWGLNDTTGSLKRTFNLSIGSNYLSNTSPSWTLRDEQLRGEKKASKQEP